jgi:hypothetical protein
MHTRKIRSVRLLFLLPGEKVRMRASVKQIGKNDRPHPCPLLQGEGESFRFWLRDNSCNPCQISAPPVLNGPALRDEGGLAPRWFKFPRSIVRPPTENSRMGFARCLIVQLQCKMNLGTQSVLSHH